MMVQSVDELQQHGINMQDILKLKNSGICTILGVAQTTRKNLLKIKVWRFSRLKRSDS